MTSCHHDYHGLLRSGRALSRDPVRGLDTEHSVLFVGNSYTSSHFLVGRIFSFWTEANPALAVSVGYHLRNGANLSFQNSALTQASWLSESRRPEPNGWNTIVIQEESRSLAYPPSDERYQRSAAALTEVVEQFVMADRDPPRILLFLTWGRAVGDSHSELNSFVRMQQRLDQGVDEVARSLRSRFAVAIDIAPVGQAFLRVYEDELASHRDPNRLGSFFHSLYASDGSHPSWRGSYLAASVIYGTLTGRDAPPLVGENHPVIRGYLRNVAHRIVMRGRV